MPVDVLSFGCRLNAAEADALRRRAESAGHGDLVVVNSCTVTEEAGRQVRQAIRRTRRERPDTPVFVTGCGAQVEPDLYAAMPEVDRVLGNAVKDQAEAWAPGPGRLVTRDVMAAAGPLPVPHVGSEGRTRAFLQVQNGCDHRCTFCVIPFGRGRSRSVPADAVVAEATRLVEAGTREIVLTGVDLTSWGGDLPGTPRLGRLVRAILSGVPGLPRLRLSSIDSVEMDRELLAAIAEEPRLMPHLHLSLQAGDDLVLKRMKRRHTRAGAIDLCAELRRLRPDLTLGADLIAGFPTETEDMFRRTLDLVGQCGLTRLHVFPFSPRPGTPAAHMPQVDPALARERAARLRAAGDAAFRAHLSAQVGRTHLVLAEKGGRGRTPDFSPVTFAAPPEPGRIGEVTILGEDGRSLLAA